MLSIKSIFRYYLFLLVLLGASALHAAPALGFVDVIKVTRDAPQMKEVEKVLKDEFVLREQKIIEMRDQIAALQEKLDKEKRSMSADERRRLERDIKSRELRYNYNKDEFLQDKQLRTNEERSRVFKVIDEVIDQVGKAKSLQMVFTQRGGSIVWFDQSVDITDDVMQQLQSIAKPIAQPQK